MIAAKKSKSGGGKTTARAMVAARMVQSQAPPKPKQTAPAGPAAGPAASVRLVVVDSDREGQRLDNFLLGQLKGAPRSLVYRLLRSGQVRVDGGRCKPDQRLQGGETVRIPPVRLPAAGAPIAASSQSLEALEKSFLYEDDDLLVLNKPSGLAAHGGSGVSYGAIEALRQLRPKAKLELIHRLDRDTSGLMLVAKRRSILLAVQEQLRVGSVDKRYLSLLAGRVQLDRFDVNAPLRKQVLSGGERMVQVSSDGKASLSRFRVLERFANCTLVEVKIETGRTHQIRVHALHSGHPVAGDPKYGDPELNQSLRSFGLDRLFLHAASMRLRLPDAAKDRQWSAQLPEKLEQVLVRLRAEG